MCLGGAIIAEVTSAVAGPAHTPTTVPEVVETEEHTDDITDEETADTGGGQQTTDTRLDEGSEEHTSELQSHVRISYAVFCLKKKKMSTIDLSP